jgi:hypothetical protein
MPPIALDVVALDRVAERPTSSSAALVPCAAETALRLLPMNWNSTGRGI